jgi:hypothetical protein
MYFIAKVFKSLIRFTVMFKTMEMDIDSGF